MPCFPSTFQCPPEPLDIIRRLQDAGHRAVLAGGCVRDALRGLQPHDWDIATSARPAQIEGLFPRTIPVGKAFGIIVVLAPSGAAYEVATFRGESDYRDGRHPETIRFVDEEEDVKRRDFTVNALLGDPLSGEILDFVGGVEDLRKGILRAVGRPDLRFQEDKLRLLRAIRFAANLHLTIEAETWQAIRAHARELLPCVSSERIASECEKMLLGGASREAFHLLEASGLLEEIFPELAACRGVAQPPQFHPEGDVWQHELKLLAFFDETLRNRLPVADEANPPDWQLRFDARTESLRAATTLEWRILAWAALLHDVGKPPTFTQGEDRIHFNGHDEVGAKMAESRLTQLRLPSAVIQGATRLVQRHMHCVQLLQARIPTKRRRYQEADFPLLLELLRLDTMASFGQLEQHHAILQEWREEQARPKPPKPTLNGRDLLALGIPPGPRLGALLRAAADHEWEHPFPNREAALAWLKMESGLFPEPK